MMFIKQSLIEKRFNRVKMFYSNFSGSIDSSLSYICVFISNGFFKNENYTFYGVLAAG